MWYSFGAQYVLRRLSRGAADIEKCHFPSREKSPPGVVAKPVRKANRSTTQTALGWAKMVFERDKRKDGPAGCLGWCALVVRGHVSGK